MHTGEHLIIKPAMASKVMKREWRFSASLNKVYPYGAQEWNVDRINKTGGESGIWNLKSDE